MRDLDINPNVQELAFKVFDPTEWREVQEIAAQLIGSKKQKRMAISRLQLIIPTRPKRPLYYIHHELKFLPRTSRFVVEQMGSYLDLMVKELRFELEGQYYKMPLGRNIAALLKNDDADMELLRKLMMFNEIAYVPAKHLYGSPDDPKHYFNSQETIVIVLTAVKLGEALKKRSSFVRNLCQDLVLPAQRPLIGDHERTDRNGVPFNFKKSLIDSK